jgi:hypothetical protein
MLVFPSVGLSFLIPVGYFFPPFLLMRGFSSTNHLTEEQNQSWFSGEVSSSSCGRVKRCPYLYIYYSGRGLHTSPWEHSRV